MAKKQSRQARVQIGSAERRIAKTSVELRAAGAGDDGPQIAGYGAVFNVETVIGGYFREKILPGAFADSLAQDDVRVAFNHNSDHILGRTSAKTAQITEDGNGLRYVATPPDATWAKDLAASIKRRDITGSSFQFVIDDPDWEEWDYGQTKDGMLPLRTITRATLIECGPVSYPAYEETTAEARDRAGAAAARGTCAACAGQMPCQACSWKDARAAAGEEAAELVQYQTLETLLGQAATTLAAMRAIVAALVGDEVETPAEGTDDEVGEDQVEVARGEALLAFAGQIDATIDAIAAIARGIVDENGDDDDSLMLMDRALALDEMEARGA